MDATTTNPPKTHNGGGAQRIKLMCPECGNSHRFIQVMAEETHLVDGSLNYIGLLEGIVDHYICWQCGASMDDSETT